MKLSRQDFLGTWSISREITDHKIMETGVLSGEASFSERAGQLLYSEQGTLRFAGGAPMKTERQYLWTFFEDRVDVSFEDGRAFHSFALTGAPEASVHYCGEDVYRGSYWFHTFPTWKVVWSVKGPRKDYRSETVFVRR